MTGRMTAAASAAVTTSASLIMMTAAVTDGSSSAAAVEQVCWPYTLSPSTPSTSSCVDCRQRPVRPSFSSLATINVTSSSSDSSVIGQHATHLSIKQLTITSHCDHDPLRMHVATCHQQPLHQKQRQQLPNHVDDATAVHRRLSPATDSGRRQLTTVFHGRRREAVS